MEVSSYIPNKISDMFRSCVDILKNAPRAK